MFPAGKEGAHERVVFGGADDDDDIFRLFAVKVHGKFARAAEVVHGADDVQGVSHADEPERDDKRRFREHVLRTDEHRRQYDGDPHAHDV